MIDYLEVSSEKNRDNRFTKDDVLSVSGEYGIVNQIEFQGRSFAGTSVSNYGVVENGDVVYTKSPLKSNPYGIIKTNKGIPGIVSTLYAVYKPKAITDSKFVQIYFELDSRMNYYMHPLVNKGAKNDMKVSAENALKGMVSFPKKDEQEMISLYFTNLDHLITLHQRKSFYNIANINVWEQRKLCEITNYSNGKGHEGNQSDEGSYELINLNSISIDGGLKPSGKFIEDGTDTLLENDLVMVLSDVGHGDLLGRVAIIPENNRFVLNQRVALLRIMDNTNPYFLFSIINKHQAYFKKEGAGSSQLNISKSSVENFVVDYPQIEEQIKIANYFENLDNLITLHRRAYHHIKRRTYKC